MKRFVFLGATLAIFLSVGLASAQTTVPLTEWPLANANSGPTGITVDPFGNVYFLESRRARIGRLDPATGASTEWEVPFPGNFAVSRIFAAPDGQIFYANSGAASSVTRFDPATTVLTRWAANFFFDVDDIGLDTSDPENPMVWVIGLGRSLPRLDPAKNEYQEFRIAIGGAGQQIEVDAHGVAWSTWQAPVLVRLDPISGERIAYADCQLGPGCTPGQRALTGGTFAIRLDEDGRVIFSEPFVPTLANKIGQFDPETSVVTEYAVPTPNAGVSSLAVADTHIFFTESRGNNLGRLDPALAAGTDTALFADVATIAPLLRPRAPSTSSLTPVDFQLTPSSTDVTSNVADGFEEFAVPTAMSSPFGVVVAGCSVFFTEQSGNKIGRVQIPPERPMRKLKHRVGRLPGKSVLKDAQARSLNEKLEEALYFFGFQNAGGAAVVLRGFMDEVSDLVQAGAVSLSEGRSLLTAAGHIVHFCN